ncbi:MAG: DUF6515 family protein [Pseudomonadota bacterium]
MNKKTVSRLGRALYLMLACALGAPSGAWAEGAHYLDRLPRGHVDVTVRGARYFYHGGYFYQHGPRGYLRVRPPLGAVVEILPLGIATLAVAGVTYHTFGGVYYRQVPTGYVVVAPPTGVAVASPEPPVVVAPSPAPNLVVVTSPTLNVRSGPGFNNPVVTVVSQGSTLEVRGVAEGWLRVMAPNGQTGWVARQFTAPAGGAQPNG